MTAYYNEFDPKAAAWLRELIKGGHIADGEVDERSIKEVVYDDIKKFTQVHFFAGIGGWSLALRLAGWPDDRPVWTGSCPCQPFSAAGKGLGTDDPRHLWPEFFRIITDGKPPVIFGEQVASKDGRGWLAGVRDDLEALAYAVGSADLCAASTPAPGEGWFMYPNRAEPVREACNLGPPNIRQRICWVADADLPKRRESGSGSRVAGEHAVQCEGPENSNGHPGRGPDDGVANAKSNRWSQGNAINRRGAGRTEATGRGFTNCGENITSDVRMDNTDNPGPQERGLGFEQQLCEERRKIAQRPVGLSGRPSFWGLSDFAYSERENKIRRIEPGSAPLVDGLPGRVGLLRGYGNAINPQMMCEFIGAYDDLRRFD